jgi:hypothetical protein
MKSRKMQAFLEFGIIPKLPEYYTVSPVDDTELPDDHMVSHVDGIVLPEDLLYLLWMSFIYLNSLLHLL